MVYWIADESMCELGHFDEMALIERNPRRAVIVHYASN